jgi:hypothetical protein
LNQHAIYSNEIVRQHQRQIVEKGSWSPNKSWSESQFSLVPRSMARPDTVLHKALLAMYDVCTEALRRMDAAVGCIPPEACKTCKSQEKLSLVSIRSGIKKYDT